MKRAIILLCALVLPGCATRLPERVEVPISVPCKVRVPDEPVWATASLPSDAGIFDQAKALLAERKQRIAHIERLRAAAASCQ